MALLPLHIRNLFGKLITSSDKETCRIRTDESQTSFWEGREFRLVEPIDGSLVIKVSAACDFIVRYQDLVVQDGELIMLAYRASDGVESGTFTDSYYQVGNNLMSTAPSYTQQVKMQTGGSFTPTNASLYRDKLHAKTATSTAHQSSVGTPSVKERGLPSGDYYLVFSGGGEGDFYLVIEERPVGLL